MLELLRKAISGLDITDDNIADIRKLAGGLNGRLEAFDNLSASY